MVPQAAGARRPRVLVGAGVLVAAVLAAGAWWANPPHPATVLLESHEDSVTTRRTSAPELGARLERWSIETRDGRRLRGIFRAAEPKARAAAVDPAWAVVLLGGIDTGERAALLLPDSLPMDVLALDWPWSGPLRMSATEFVGRLPAILAALHRAPSALAQGVTSLRRERGPVRVALLGASLGSPAASAALRLTEVDALVLVDGMADLRAVYESEMRRVIGPPWLAAACASPFAGLAARLTDALEPARHADAATAIPVLLLDAETESRYPGAAVRALHASYPHATRLRHPGGHMRPRRTEQMREIVRLVGAWLTAQPADSRAAVRPVAQGQPAGGEASVERGVDR